MWTIRDKVEGGLTLDKDTRLHGMIVGKTVVASGVLLELHGMVVGDVVLQPGSRVRLYGMVNGDVTNQGGSLEVFGIINGNLVREGGDTIVHSKAIVRGKDIQRQSEDP